MKHATLHERMAAAVGQRTYREIADLTGTHQETVRRYLQGQAPSVDFLAALGRSLGLSGTWLLTGHGAMFLEDVRGDALREADVADLLNAMAETINGMIDRIERLEVFVQTLETRLRAAKAPAGDMGAGASASGGDGGTPEQPEVHTRARRIARAVAERSPGAADRDAQADRA